MFSSFFDPTIVVVLVVGHEVLMLVLALIAVIFPSRAKTALRLIEMLRWRPRLPDLRRKT